jgi:Skp family chaperone for outer membrane proteins
MQACTMITRPGRGRLAPARPDRIRSRPSLLLRLGLVVLGMVLAGGCRGRAQNPAATAADARIGVVDLQTVTRAHPRWQDLDAVLQQEKDVQAQLALIPQPPSVPAADVQRLLDEEAKHLRAELDKEVEFLRVSGQRQIETFAGELRHEGEAQLAQIQHDLNAQGEEALVAKRDELRAQLRAAEQQIRDEYRYPLLNLRLRAEVAGLASEEEGKQLAEQLRALQDERDARIQAKVDELQQAFLQFQKAKEEEMNAKLKAEQGALEAEGRQRLVARQQTAEAEFARAAADLEKGLQTRLERRRQEIIQGAQAPLPARQGTYTQSVVDRSRQLQSELVALQEKQQRLEDSILAEVKIEVATIAQARRLDVVLTRYISNVAGINITPDVIAKFHR